MKAFFWSMAYKKPILVEETELLARAVGMPVNKTLKARLLSISYVDMAAAVEKTFASDYSYSCHGDIFEITRHCKRLR